ncbi:MAG: YebC/PmpR family DNA-binding transcriptional regulator [Acidobacteriota bacterium]
MSGHSKWHSIKHKKAAADSKRGKIFTKLIKEMSVAARIGGGDPDSNPRLRTAVAAAKAVNMPLDNIKRAIMKGTGELPGQSYEGVTYEGYGPGGAAVMVETLTDNKNRTVAEIRHLFSKHGGNLAETGAVQWMFERKGYIVVSKEKADEERLMEIVLEAGAEDLRSEDSTFAVYTTFESFEGVKHALQAAGIEPDSAELTMVPQNGVHLEGKKAEQMLKLMESLEDHDDVQNVYANFDIDEAEMEAIANS